MSSKKGSIEAVEASWDTIARELDRGKESRGLGQGSSRWPQRTGRCTGCGVSRRDRAQVSGLSSNWTH